MRKIRRRSAEEPAAPPPPPPPPPPVRRSAEELADGRRGAAAALWGLTRRKVRTLGKRWKDATKFQRDREAARQAREELASRIEAQTGRRPSDRTLRRHIAAGTAPRGVDADALVRQAAIDAVGGLARFARSRGMTPYKARKWRDEGGELPAEIPESLGFAVTLVATMLSKGQQYKKDQVWSAEVTVTGAGVARVLAAAESGQFGPVQDLLGQLVVEQFPWVGKASRELAVSEVVELIPLQ